MFSIVVPVYNHATFLAQAVFSALRCPLAREILLLDDGSTDESPQIAANLASDYPDRVRDVTPAGDGNRGAHQRLNELVELAQDEWIAVLNSDDVFVADRFETILGDSQFANSDFIFGDVLFMNERGALVGAKRAPLDRAAPALARMERSIPAEPDRLVDLLSRENYLISTSNMVFRKALHARIGGFAAYRYVHDWDFALRAMSLGRARHIPRFLTAYRKHFHNTIREDENEVYIEIGQMFAHLAADFPERSKTFSAGLQGPEALSPPKGGVA